MEEREYESVAQMQGSMSQQNVAEPAAFERANYMKVLQSWRHDPDGHVARLDHICRESDELCGRAAPVRNQRTGVGDQKDRPGKLALFPRIRLGSHLFSIPTSSSLSFMDWQSIGE